MLKVSAGRSPRVERCKCHFGIDEVCSEITFEFKILDGQFVGDIRLVPARFTRLARAVGIGSTLPKGLDQSGHP